MLFAAIIIVVHLLVFFVIADFKKDYTPKVYTDFHHDWILVTSRKRFCGIFLLFLSITLKIIFQSVLQLLKIPFFSLTTIEHPPCELLLCDEPKSKSMPGYSTSLSRNRLFHRYVAQMLRDATCAIGFLATFVITSRLFTVDPKWQQLITPTSFQSRVVMIFPSQTAINAPFVLLARLLLTLLQFIQL